MDMDMDVTESKQIVYTARDSRTTHLPAHTWIAQKQVASASSTNSKTMEKPQAAPFCRHINATAVGERQIEAIG